MTLDVQTLRDELREHLGVDDNDLPDTAADLLLNRAYWHLIDIYQFREKEVTATFDTIIGTRSYDMPSPFEALRQLSILDQVTQKHKTLDKMTIFQYENSYIEGEDNYGVPTGYVREGCFARLFPTPDDIYTITIKYWTTLADLVAGNEPNIPQSWHEILLYGAVWRGWLRLGDYARSNQIKMYQASLINDAVPVESKEEFDTHNAGLDVKWDD